MATILVVDDHATNRELIVALVNHKGHRPLEAADGAEALAIARSARPDLIISDILMPTMDGYEFVRRLRADPAIAGTEVIFYTAHYHEREARNLARACGVTRVLTKPSEPEEILRTIDEALAGAPRVAATGVEGEFDREHLRLMTDKLSEKVAELRSANFRLAALNDVNLKLASERDPRTLLKDVCRDGRDLVGARYAVLCVRDKADASAIFCTTSGMSAAASAKLSVPALDEGVLGTVLAKGMPLRGIDPGADPRSIGLPGGYPLVHSWLAAPVSSLSATYGWICLLNKVGRDGFDDEDVSILTSLASQVGRIYENGALYAEVKRHAEELRESEQRFRQLAENIHEVFFLTDVTNSQMLYVSPAYQQIWGRSRESLYAKPSSWIDAIHPDDLHIALASNERRDASGEFDYEHRIVRPDGSIRWIKTRGFPIRDAGGTVYRIAGIAEDITQRVALQTELREREAALSRAQALASLGHIVSNADGSFESWSDSLPRLIGYDLPEVPDTRSWVGLLHPDDRERFRSASLEAARTGARFDIEYRLRRRDGEVIHVRQVIEPLSRESDAQGRRRWFSTLQDISEQKRAGEALRESERRFSTMLGNVQLISLMLDTTARVTYCNDFLLRLTGWTREEVLGRNWFDLFIPPAIALETRGVFEALIQDLPDAWHHDNEILTRSGEQRFVRWNNSVLRSATGDIIGCSSIGEDITEQKRAEDEVRRLNADLEQRVAERTAELEAANKELEAFDYSVSHDLRAPLRHIQGFGGMLLSQHSEKLDESGQDCVKRVLAASKRMDQLVTDLLHLSTATRGELQRADIDVSGIAEAVLASLKKAQGERQVTCVVQPGLKARADPGMLHAVLDNLLSNAWKFTRKREDARIEFGATRTAEQKTFFIRDNGAGFDMAYADKLFAPLQRLHSQQEFEGTGIGLATVQRIIRRHGGKVWAESSPDAGATFYFTL